MGLATPRTPRDVVLAVVLWIGIGLSYADPLLRSQLCTVMSP